jgi:hypothetical protein
LSLAAILASTLIDGARQSVFGILGFLDCRVCRWPAAPALIEGLRAVELSTIGVMPQPSKKKLSIVAAVVHGELSASCSSCCSRQ